VEVLLDDAKYILKITISRLFLPLCPAFLLLDYLYFQPIFGICIALRAGAMAAAAGIYFYTGRIKTQAQMQGALLAFAFLAANFLLIINWFGGSIVDSTYWVGVGLVASAVLPFFPWNKRFLYVAPFVLFAPLFLILLDESTRRSSNKETVAIFMFCLGFAAIGLVCNHFLDFLRKRGISNYLKLQQIEADREVDNQISSELYIVKMASIGETASHIAREISNPLMIITGSCHQLLSRDTITTDQQKAKGYVEKIAKTADRISKILVSIDKQEIQKLISLIDQLEDVLRTWTFNDKEKARGLFERINTIIAKTEELSTKMDPTVTASFMAEWRRRLHPYFLQAPNIVRSYVKPLGYAGDYEIMKMAYRNQPEGETTLGKILHQWFNASHGATAVRSRRRWIIGQMETHGRTATAPYRLASIASGPAYELSDFVTQSYLVERAEVTCLDQDLQSLKSADKTLQEAMKLANRHCPTHFINESVRTLIKDPSKLPPQNFIYSLGLYDYLDKKAATLLTQVLFDRLLPGGQLVVGNYSPRTDVKFAMDLIMDWQLIYRSEEDLIKIADSIKGEKKATVTSESTGMQLFLILDKKL
jgi:signal transduction histidine kinase